MTDETQARDADDKLHEDTDVDSYEAMQAEVDKHFEGSWERFLKAVQNASEVLHFVLTHHCGTDPTRFEAWATEKQLPAGWVPRFFTTLTADGQLKS